MVEEEDAAAAATGGRGGHIMPAGGPASRMTASHLSWFRLTATILVCGDRELWLRTSEGCRKSEPLQHRFAWESRSGIGHTAWATRRAAERLRAGHLWVYASGVEQVLPVASGGAAVSLARC